MPAGPGAADTRDKPFILGWVTQLSDGGPNSLAQLDVELNCSDSVFVGIQNYLSVVQVFVRIPCAFEDTHHRSDQQQVNSVLGRDRVALPLLSHGALLSGSYLWSLFILPKRARL